jgi:hypothetical protein
MPRRRRKTFKASKEARRIARETVGIPPPAKVIPDKRRKPTRHKPTREELANE